MTNRFGIIQKIFSKFSNGRKLDLKSPIEHHAMFLKNVMQIQSAKMAAD